MHTTRIIIQALIGLGLTLGAASAASVPANLVGEWRAGDTSTSGYENLSTGQWRSARSESYRLRLAADGSYEYVGIMLMQSAGCESRIFDTEKGQAVFSGGKLTLKPTSGDVQYYLCDPKNVKKGTLKASDWSWKLGKDSAGKEALLLGSADGKGNPTPYYRAAASAAATSASAAPRTISGSITAAGGHSLKNTVIVACPKGDCESDGVKGVAISAAGSSTTFVLSGLDDVPYAIYALQDNDGNEDVNAGDWVNREFLADGDVPLVKIGAKNVKLELVAVK
ncbi:hypothetical protein [Deinococcus yavapaiensis]|uniref:Secreted protein n=1 Tax=Deinococcus yavapaiensis KR-236 TaxID=694435 RepID=A0A318SDD0_9DEIO|nr:hypothetical protein [Deinococcus yavapaiensis]PYE55404.1 hypothetical protein DES52_103237 [Deinococcus yavapaiensis KR-236]